MEEGDLLQLASTEPGHYHVLQLISNGAPSILPPSFSHEDGLAYVYDLPLCDLFSWQVVANPVSFLQLEALEGTHWLAHVEKHAGVTPIP